MKKQDRVNEIRPSAHLAELAEHLETTAGWGDLTLPAAESRRLHEIVRHMKHRAAVSESFGHSSDTPRGPGVIAHFEGPQDSGKVLAAAMLANDLNLPLYRIDLSLVVNKYVGETEKNLSRVFDAAGQIEAVLFFDEADVLFGKRSEIKGSHDRYANIEVEHILQRLESLRGLAILSTNSKSELFSAFARRIHYIIRFPSPRGPEIVKRAGIKTERKRPNE